MSKRKPTTEIEDLIALTSTRIDMLIFGPGGSAGFRVAERILPLLKELVKEAIKMSCHD